MTSCERKHSYLGTWVVSVIPGTLDKSLLLVAISLAVVLFSFLGVDKNDPVEKGFILAHGSQVQPIMMGKSTK